MKMSLEEIERKLSSFPPPTPELFREIINNMLVDYNGFYNISTRYIISKSPEEMKDYWPFTKTELPKRFSNPPKDIRGLEYEYQKFVSGGVVPAYISIRTIHRKEKNKEVITFIHNGTLENFLDINYRLPNINTSVDIVSTEFFGRPSGMLPLENIEKKKKFREKARHRQTTPLDAAFEEGYVCMLPSGRIQLSALQILKATKPKEMLV